MTTGPLLARYQDPWFSLPRVGTFSCTQDRQDLEPTEVKTPLGESRKRDSGDRQSRDAGKDRSFARTVPANAGECSGGEHTRCADDSSTTER